jgi:hypothetical protein
MKAGPVLSASSPPLPPGPTPPWFRAARIASGLVVAGLCVAGLRMWWSTADSPPHPAVLSSHTPRGPQARCSECHADITDQFHLAPHSRTLHRATDPAVIELFAGRSFQRADQAVEFHYRLQDDELQVLTTAYPRPLSVHWIFGSGTHAQTPLITWTDDEGRTTSIEHSVSCYPSGKLDVTLGMEALTDSAGVFPLGRHWQPAETANCFGCHCTHVPTERGRILFDQIEPNIGCVRCHWDTSRHLDEVDRDITPSIERLSQLSPTDAVERCGECHRRASEMGAKITPDIDTIVRFAPVGLVQSACFQKQHEVTRSDGQPARLDCATCHNPHRPANHDWRAHVAVCLDCHNAAQGQAADCTVATRTDNCLPCHMPPIPSNPHLQFTDHWIRVRTEPHAKQASPAE